MVYLSQDARGLDICFGYNSPRGCRRSIVDATTCRDPLTHVSYAHYCSNWDAGSNTHCLQTHPRHSNH